MRFGEFRTWYDDERSHAKHNANGRRRISNGPEWYYRELFHETTLDPIPEWMERYTRMHNGHLDVTLLQATYIAEASWIKDGRPYYKVWPSVVKPLSKLALDVTGESLNLRPRTILLRFGDTNESYRLPESILVKCEYSEDGEACLTVIGYMGLAFVMRLNEHTIDEQLSLVQKSRLHSGYYSQYSEHLMAKVAISVLLLADDPSLIEPDVLTKDELSYERTRDNKYIDKAHRRGKIGWHIGKTLETIPHFRRPHLAIRHTGVGRTVPRIVQVKGCVVHRERVTMVPTGHIAEDGTEIEV